MTCLNQVATFGYDKAKAMVDFAPCEAATTSKSGVTNTYALGHFNSGSVLSAHVAHNSSFATLSNFTVTIWVSTLFGEYALGQLRFTAVATLDGLECRRLLDGHRVSGDETDDVEVSDVELGGDHAAQEPASDWEQESSSSDAAPASSRARRSCSHPAIIRTIRTRPLCPARITRNLAPLTDCRR